MKIAKRRQLLPAEKDHARADEPYFKLELSNLRELPHPIVSNRKRPIVFIPTTTRKLLWATEVNDLFSDSPIEDELWIAFKAEQIQAERQYFVGKSPRLFALDFAVFCRIHKLDVECDGDLFHADLTRMRKDRRRNNVLESLGWKVLRFGTDDIRKHKNETLHLIKETINGLGGMEVAEAPGQYRVFSVGNQSRQAYLFERDNA